MQDENHLQGLSVTFTYKVRYAETDRMGGYYNARALEWFEMGRSELSHAMGMPYTEWEKRGIFMPVIEASVKYRGRATYDDLLEMTVSSQIVGRTRLQFFNTIVQASDRRAVCSGWTMHALVDERGYPIRIPQWVSDLFFGQKADG